MTRHTGSALPRLAVALGALGLLIALVGLVAGLGLGWRAHIMSTASMGSTAPVGSLVLTRPVSAGALRAGEVIAFHPPGQPHTTFVHRIVALTRTPAGPQLLTQGRLAGSVDPWSLHTANVVGRTVAIIPVLGWLLRMAPWLSSGVLVVALLASQLSPERRRALQIVGTSVVATVVLLVWRPLVAMEVVSGRALPHGGAVSVVATGILPVTVRALAHATGSPAHLVAGQQGLVTSSRLSRHGLLEVTARLHLYGSWWWLLLLVAAPLAAGLLIERDCAAATGELDATGQPVLPFELAANEADRPGPAAPLTAQPTLPLAGLVTAVPAEPAPPPQQPPPDPAQLRLPLPDPAGEDRQLALPVSWYGPRSGWRVSLAAEADFDGLGLG